MPQIVLESSGPAACLQAALPATAPPNAGEALLVQLAEAVQTSTHDRVAAAVQSALEVYYPAPNPGVSAADVSAMLRMTTRGWFMLRFPDDMPSDAITLYCRSAEWWHQHELALSGLPATLAPHHQAVANALLQAVAQCAQATKVLFQP